MILQERFQAVADIDPGFFALAAHYNVHVRLLTAFLRQHANVGAAEHDRAVVDFLNHACGAPGLLHLGRVGRDAHKIGTEFLDEVGDRFLLYVGVEDHDFVPATLADSRQIGESQMRRGTRIDGEPELRIDKSNAHYVPSLHNGMTLTQMPRILPRCRRRPKFIMNNIIKIQRVQCAHV